MVNSWPERPRILHSYAYTNRQKWPVPFTADTIIDSGAFTAHTQGIKIDLDEYCDFLKAHQDRITHAAALDVIGDWRATARNYDRMEARLGGTIPVLPAWHLGSPMSELERLCREHDYVAIGGCVPYGKRPKVLMQHLIPVHKVARRYGTRLHGLGVTGLIPATKLPWYSVDSSTWEQGNRFGHMSLLTRAGASKDIRFSQPLDLEARRLVRRYDADPDVIEAPGFNQAAIVGARQAQDTNWVNQSAARSMMVLEGICRVKHRTELRIYLASAAYASLLRVVPAWQAGNPFA